MISKVCYCGMWISGSTIEQVEYNMKLHKEGKLHKKQINAKGDKK